MPGNAGRCKPESALPEAAPPSTPVTVDERSPAPGSHLEPEPPTHRRASQVALAPTGRLPPAHPRLRPSRGSAVGHPAWKCPTRHPPPPTTRRPPCLPPPAQQTSRPTATASPATRTVDPTVARRSSQRRAGPRGSACLVPCRSKVLSPPSAALTRQSRLSSGTGVVVHSAGTPRGRHRDGRVALMRRGAATRREPCYDSFVAPLLCPSATRRGSRLSRDSA